MITDNDPMNVLKAWLAEAEQSEPCDANAMTLATVDMDLVPNVRVLLLKDITKDGLCFYTNQTSTKAKELTNNSHAAIGFYWKSLGKQIRVRGSVNKVNDSLSDAYFKTRARESQIGAWASQQSKTLADRSELEQEIEHFENKFKDEQEIPRPPHWGGYCLTPLEMEFWKEQPHRLHNRQLFTRNDADSPWNDRLLYP